MFRRPLSSRVACTTQRGHFTASLPLRQIQDRDRVLGTHGAGLVKHESMATMNLSHTFIRNVANAAPAADLFRTPVHQGLGTSSADPYTRTLPNQESRPPESTVLTAAAITAATLDERQTLAQRWGSLQYWIGDPHPRLPLFLEGLLVTPALPVSATAEAMVQDFATSVIPALAKELGAGRETELRRLWADAVREYGVVNSAYVFDKQAFERELAKLHGDFITRMTSLTTKEDGALALELLRRKAVLRRNYFIEQQLLPLVRNSEYFNHGDAVWRIFFDRVKSNKAELFSTAAGGTQNSAVLAYAWDAVMHEDVVRMPAMTAPVALFFLLASVAESHHAVPDSMKESSSNLDSGVGSTVHQRDETPFACLDPIRKRRFVSAALEKQLSSVKGSAALAAVLHTAKIHGLSREAALCETMLDNQRLLEADVAEAVGRFDSTGEVRSLLSSLINGTDEAARQHVREVFTIAANERTIDWDKIFFNVDWSSNWRRLSIALLSNTATLTAIQKLLCNAIGAKGATKRLYSEEYTRELEVILRQRQQRAAERKAKVESIIHDLSSFHAVDRTLELLRSLGVSVTALEEEVAVLQKQKEIPRHNVDTSVLDVALQAVEKRHPAWKAAGVLLAAAPAATGVRRDLFYLECMARIFLRLAYTPQAGAAAIAQHTRRRIGNIGKEPHQQNIPAEVGFVEQYDNLQYKRYDWQGWYQRMVDVHNRNVSLRCRIGDLKRLDSYGNPFVDLQTERRLRILADHRVGMGVVKLDSDKYEDQPDNITFGLTKLSELIADARKAQLGREYWPTVEVKVRRPSGQSKTYYSVMDEERIEKKSAELYAKYRDAKKRSLFVTPMDLWLDVKGLQVRKTAESGDEHGYTVDSLQGALGSDSES